MDKREAIKIAKKYVDSLRQHYQIENAFLFGQDYRINRIKVILYTNTCF